MRKLLSEQEKLCNPCKTFWRCGAEANLNCQPMTVDGEENIGELAESQLLAGCSQRDAVIEKINFFLEQRRLEERIKDNMPKKEGLCPKCQSFKRCQIHAGFISGQISTHELIQLRDSDGDLYQKCTRRRELDAEISPPDLRTSRPVEEIIAERRQAYLDSKPETPNRLPRPRKVKPDTDLRSSKEESQTSNSDKEKRFFSQENIIRFLTRNEIEQGSAIGCLIRELITLRASFGLIIDSDHQSEYESQVSILLGESESGTSSETDKPKLTPLAKKIAKMHFENFIKSWSKFS